jgi:ribosomal protein L12E/L44/L45/RPP1/RPP2
VPLKKGSSKGTREENIKEMIKAGHDPKQAVAAAYRQQREAQHKRGKK